MNKIHQTKQNPESNNEQPVSTNQNAVEIQIEHENENNKTDKVNTNKYTIVNIEEPGMAKSIDKVKRNYWVMFWNTSGPQEKGPLPLAQQQANCFPLNCISSYVTKPAQTPPLKYKSDSRNPFVMLVLSIVLIMILATAAFVGYVLITPDVKEFFQDSGCSILLPALFLIVVVDYSMMCSPCTRQPPCNCFFLFLVVLGMSLICAVLATYYRTEVVLYAIIATAVVVFVCGLLACSNFDFTSWLLFVIVIATGLSIVTIIVIIVSIATGTMMKPVLIGVLAISTVLQSIILTIQLQIVLGGKVVKLSESDYALGAFFIYISIIDIFVKILQIIGLSES